MAKVSHFGVPRKETMLLLLLLLMHAFSILMVFFKKKPRETDQILLDKKDEIFALAQRNSIGMQKQTIFCNKILFCQILLFTSLQFVMPSNITNCKDVNIQ